MADEENLDLTELDEDQSGPPELSEEDSAADARKGRVNANELEAVYDIPVQVSAVLG